jgi:predicted unusual protein kinase regulating ubiquinone biosynthesis (AarF/ABC1/UbiB family)
VIASPRWRGGSQGSLVDVHTGVKCTARQFFEVGFFHADPHPGNLLVDSENRLAYLDFGKMDRLEDDDRFALMSVVVHFATRGG